MTPLQTDALRKMLSRDGGSAYSLQCSINTLNALALKKLVRAKHNLGSMFNPRTGISWYITDEGKKVIRAIDAR